jgi:hypothetical protein
VVRSTDRRNTLTFEQEVECDGTATKATKDLIEGRDAMVAGAGFANYRLRLSLAGKGRGL